MHSILLGLAGSWTGSSLQSSYKLYCRNKQIWTLYWVYFFLFQKHCLIQVIFKIWNIRGSISNSHRSSPKTEMLHTELINTATLILPMGVSVDVNMYIHVGAGVCMGVYICMCEHIEIRGQHWVLVLKCLPSFVGDTISHWNLWCGSPLCVLWLPLVNKETALDLYSKAGRI